MDLVILVLLITNTILAACAIGGFIISYLRFKEKNAAINSRLDEQSEKGENERDTTIQMLDHIKALRLNMETNQKAINELEKSLKKLEECVEHRISPRAANEIEKKRQALKEAELVRKKEQDEWKKLVAVAKGIGWVLNRIKEEEED